MSLFLKRSSKKRGLPPGSLVFLGERKEEETRITIMDYDETRVIEERVDAIETCFPFKDTSTVTWINIDGLHRVDVIAKLGEHFVLHPLLLEDVLHTEQRPKVEEYEDHLFMVLKIIHLGDEGKTLAAEQVSLIIGKNYVISFQEKVGDVFDPVRGRIRKGKGRIRKDGPDYLAYALVDAVVDSYFLVLEELGDTIESLQTDLLADPDPDDLQAILRLKRDILAFRKSIWPLREILGALLRGGSSLIEEEILVYVRDVYDHVSQVIDTLETYREILAAMLDSYLSNVGNKMNEVMKVLTIIATIFIPMTFLAGIYGMNFKYMPELDWKYGYPIFWSVVLAVLAIMLFWFKKKRWL
jgi:magnesium transporter